MQRKQREMVFLRKIWKLSQFVWSFRETWGSQGSFRVPALKAGKAKKAGLEPEDSRIRFPQSPNYFVPRFLMFFFFFKRQETQPPGRAQEPFGPRGARSPQPITTQLLPIPWPEAPTLELAASSNPRAENKEHSSELEVDLEVTCTWASSASWALCFKILQDAFW